VVDYSTRGRERNIIHFMLRGKRGYIYHGKRQVFEEYTVVFIPDGTNYVTRAEESCEGVTLLFSLQPELLEGIPRTVYQIRTYTKSEIETKFFDLYHLCNTMPTQRLRQKILALEILYAFLWELMTPASTTRLIAPALAYIAEHYKENCPVAQYARVCNLSESYFRKKFLETTGMSPIAYRNRLRFHEARRLYQSGHTMSAIAEKIGFCDENYLSRLYKRVYQKSLKDDSRFI